MKNNTQVIDIKKFLKILYPSSHLRIQDFKNLDIIDLDGIRGDDFAYHIRKLRKRNGFQDDKFLYDIEASKKYDSILYKKILIITEGIKELDDLFTIDFDRRKTINLKCGLRIGIDLGFANEIFKEKKYLSFLLHSVYGWEYSCMGTHIELLESYNKGRRDFLLPDLPEGVRP